MNVPPTDPALRACISESCRSFWATSCSILAVNVWMAATISSSLCSTSLFVPSFIQLLQRSNRSNTTAVWVVMKHILLMCTGKLVETKRMPNCIRWSYQASSSLLSEIHFICRYFAKRILRYCQFINSLFKNRDSPISVVQIRFFSMTHVRLEVLKADLCLLNSMMIVCKYDAKVSKIKKFKLSMIAFGIQFSQFINK